MFAKIVVDHVHRLDRAGGRTGEGKFASGDFAIIQREGSITEDDEAAIGERAAFVFVEIENNFFLAETGF